MLSADLRAAIDAEQRGVPGGGDVQRRLTRDEEKRLLPRLLRLRQACCHPQVGCRAQLCPRALWGTRCRRGHHACCMYHSQRWCDSRFCSVGRRPSTYILPACTSVRPRPACAAMPKGCAC